MTPELNREYLELDDPKIFEKMVSLTVHHMKPIEGHLRRGQHAKATGCVTAKFRIADDVKADLRYGIFEHPGQTFDAIVRFSNSQDTFEKDTKGTARGLGIKLLHVTGTRAVSDGDNTQDFLLIDHPVFPFPDPAAYYEFTRRRTNLPLIRNWLAIGYLALFEPKEFKIAKKIEDQEVVSPVRITYWSGSPYWLGSVNGEVGHAVKYLAIPRLKAPSPAEHPKDSHYLTQALIRDLTSQEVIFDFNVQLQTDPITTPVENVSVNWDQVSSPVPVATLHIPPQKVATLQFSPQKTDGADDFANKCESMSFNPWHALAEHRPMGGMNRLRRVVYEASVAKRSETKQA